MELIMDHLAKADNIMEWYAIQLLRPSVRVIAVLGFIALYAFACLGASRMKQKFSIADVLPRDSYVGDFLFAATHYRNDDIKPIQVVFRDVDQADPQVRRAMVEYTKQLGELGFVLEPVLESFWMTRFESFLETDTDSAQLPFVEALDKFLANPFVKAAVGNNIVRNADGEIIASRVNMRIVVSEDVQEQIRVLKTERLLTFNQPVNQGREDRLAFFTFSTAYLGFENYSRGIRSLISTGITGVVAVTAVAFIFIPHWTASLVVCPMIIVLYIELLGVMEWGGLYLNSMSSMSMTISIGLLVDFVIHVLFRYYEEPGSREQKTVAMLRTMGSSVLLGGSTTLLGTLPLVFASSDALQIVFVSFLDIVSASATA
jgi:predicted RND superfamily exporter protein